MPSGAFWKGYLKLSLVTCPVELHAAVTESGRVRLHRYNRKTGNRLKRQYIDDQTGRPVAEEDVSRGYPRGEDDHVILEEDELDAIALESSRTIDIGHFIPANAISWLWYDRPHYLFPADAVSEEAYAVIRDAMRSTATVGMARLVLYRRERAVMLVPRDNGIVLWTLRYGDEVRSPEGRLPNLAEVRPDPEALKLVGRLIKKRTSGWDASLVQDPVQEQLLGLIETLRKRRKRPARAKKEAPRETGKIVSIMDALKRSIAAETSGSPRR
jgi:DNA end-binding protein Ku